MAKTDIGPRISVEGESEYRKQMQRIVQQQKEYAAELSSTTAALGQNSTAQERASAVGNILRKQIQNQKDAISAQSLMLQKAVAKYGEASVEASKFRTSIYNTNTELQSLKSRLSDAENGLGEFADKTKDAEDAVESLNKTDAGANTFDNIEKSVAKGELIASAFKTVGKAALNAAMDVAKTGIAYNAQIEQYQVAFSNMLGSETAAVELLDQIKEDAAKTPFDTQGLVKANQYLISTGVNAESARKTILALGDAVSATGGGNEELSRMAQNLQQIKNAGKATAADIKQFAYAGIDVYGILADYTGKSTEEVQKMTVTYDLLTAALESAAEEGGRYYNAMSTQSETINGQWNTLKDNATQLAGLLTEDLTTALGKVVSGMNDITVAAAEAYKTDGWSGLIGEITGLSDVADRAKSSFVGLKAVFDSFKSGEIGILHGDWDSVYWNAFNNSYQNRKAGEKNEKYWKEYGERLKKQYGLDNKNETPVVVPSNTSSSSSPKKAAADQKKLANSVTETNTQLLEGTGNIVGAIKQVTETADNTYNVYDGTTKQLKGTTQETAQTVTRTWTEMVDGIQKNYKQVVTLLNGVEQSSKTTVENVTTAGKTSVVSKSEKIYGVDGVVGALDRTTQTTKKIEQVIDQTTGEVKENVVSTTDVVTDSYTAIVDGVAQAVTRTTTYVNGIVTDVQEKTNDLKTEIKGVQGTVGSFSQFILDLDTKLGGLEKVASDLSKSPLSNWFSDMSKGYRASDSFFDNIDLVGMAGSALSMGIQGFRLTNSPWGAAAGAIVGVATNLLGTSLSTEAGTWGADLVTGMASSMKQNAGKLATEAANLAQKIAEYIHFSRPDVGPLREYEQWMPDMVKGMAKGITDNAYVLRDAVRGLSGQMETQLTYDVGRASSALTTAYNTRRISMGGVSISIYPKEGQDAEEIAQYTIDKLQMMINSEASANGEVPVF